MPFLMCFPGRPAGACIFARSSGYRNLPQERDHYRSRDLLPGGPQNQKEETHPWISSGNRSNSDSGYLPPILDLPAQVRMASFCAVVITPWARSELASLATQLTKSPCLFTPTAHCAIRSEIVQPLGDTVLATPESQPSMTTVALRLELGH